MVKHKMRYLRGFTLIELAIVLVIIGLLVGMGAGLIGLLIKRVHYNQTRERLDANVEALIGGFRGCIPATDNSSSKFGYCDFSALRNRTDAWREDFVCLVADEIANYTSFSGRRDCDACARRTTSLKVRDEMDNGALHENIAFVLISKGPDHKLQTEINNDTVQIDLPGDSYDDLVRYVTLTELKAKLKCEYAEERLRILNNGLPYGFVGSNYNATVYAAGGVPFTLGGRYKWCVEDPKNVDAEIDFSCANTSSRITISSNCRDEDENNWTQCDSISLNGTPNSAGNYPVTFWVRDNADPSGSDDNVASKTLEVYFPSPPPGPGFGNGTCVNGYSVYNMINNTTLYWGCECYQKCAWSYNSSGSSRLKVGECVSIYKWGGFGKGWGQFKCRKYATICYSDAEEADNNTNCDVNFTGQLPLQDR